MNTHPFIEMKIVVETENYAVSGQLYTRSLYFLAHDYDEPSNDYRELAKALTRSKLRAQMITVIVNIVSAIGSTSKALDEIRWIPSIGEDVCKIARCENGRFDFDNAGTQTMSAAAFIRKYGRIYSGASLKYHSEYKVPVMGDFDENGDCI